MPFPRQLTVCEKRLHRAERSEKDRRIVYIHLTGKDGRHSIIMQNLHEQMTDAVMAELEKRKQVLGKTLKALTDFRSYKIEIKRLLQPGQNLKKICPVCKSLFRMETHRNAIFLRRSSHRYPRAHTTTVQSAQYRPRLCSTNRWQSELPSSGAIIFQSAISTSSILAVMHEPDAVAQPDAVRIRHTRRLFEYTPIIRFALSVPRPGAKVR